MGMIAPPIIAMTKAIGGQYRSRPAATLMIPPSAPDIIQNGSRVITQAEIAPPAKPIRMLKVIADRVTGVP